jgi:hypothetical protein
MVGPPSGTSCDTALPCRENPRGGHRPRFGGVPAADVRRVEMFESLKDVDKKSSGRTMQIIWIVIAVAAVVLIVISFM